MQNVNLISYIYMYINGFQKDFITFRSFVYLCISLLSFKANAARGKDEQNIAESVHFSEKVLRLI